MLSNIFFHFKQSIIYQIFSISWTINHFNFQSWENSLQRLKMQFGFFKKSYLQLLQNIARTSVQKKLELQENTFSVARLSINIYNCSLMISKQKILTQGAYSLGKFASFFLWLFIIASRRYNSTLRTSEFFFFGKISSKICKNKSCIFGSFFATCGNICENFNYINKKSPLSDRFSECEVWAQRKLVMPVHLPQILHLAWVISKVIETFIYV